MKFSFNITTSLWFIPEEELSLSKLFFWRLCREDWFKRIWVIPRVPCFCGNSHRGRSEVLHLLQMEVKVLCEHRQLRHILFLATWVRRNEVRYNLLSHILFTINAVKNLLKSIELLERWLTHKFQYSVRSVLRSHFQSTTDVACYQFTSILFSSFIALLILTFVQQ